MKTKLKFLLLGLFLAPVMLFANIASGTIDVVNPDGVSGLLTSDHNGLQYAWEDLNTTSLGLVSSDRVIWQASSPHIVIAKVANDVVISSNTSGNQILAQHDVLIVDTGVTLTGNIFADRSVVYLRPGATLDGRISQVSGALYGRTGAHVTGKINMTGASGSRIDLNGVTVDDRVKLGPSLNFVNLRNSTFNENLILKGSYWTNIGAGNTVEGNVVLKDNLGFINFNGNDVVGTTSIINTSLHVNFLNNECVNDLAINGTGGELTVEGLIMDNSPFAFTDQNAFFVNNASDINAIDLSLEGTLKLVGTGGAINAEELNAFHVVVKNTAGTVDWTAGFIDETVKLVGNQDETNVAELEIGTDLIARLNTAPVFLAELDIQGNCLFKENAEMDFQLSQIAENFTTRNNLGTIFCDVIDIGVNFKSIDDADIGFINGDVGGNLTITNPGTCAEFNNSVVGLNSGCPSAKTNHTQEPEFSGVSQNVQPTTRYISLFPQPANEVVNVTLGGDTHADRLEVVNVQGQIVHERELKQGESSLSINTSEWPSGLYILRVKGPAEQLCKKMLLN